MHLQRTHFSDGLTLDYLPNDRIIGGQIRKSGSIEPYEEDLVMSYIRPGDEVVDVGANIGVYTLQMARGVGEDGKVYAFEPEPKNAQILKHNLSENNFSNVALFDVALGDKKGKANMYLSWDNIGDHRLYDASYRRSRKTVPVRVDTMDELLFKKSFSISVIKSDTQGYEPFVIEGGQRIIKRDHPALFLEYWPFGMERAHADSEGMLDFLLDQMQYSGYVINGKSRLLALIDREHLNDFTMIPGNEEGHVNLVFLSI